MSKGTSMHVHQDSVVERRLRPIYDWLDNGNNKKALQECDKVLKKTPNSLCAKALKALALYRLGKENDCKLLLDNLVSARPVDDATLQAMMLCYREMQEYKKICEVYENAVKLDSTNEELHTQLFMSYVRISDFKLQQQSAMALYKQKPKNPYYCWAVMSIVLQATRAEGASDPQKHKLLLSLAERMFDKLIVDGKIDAEQEVQLYIMILDRLEKYEEILIILDGPLGTKLQCSNIPQNRLQYLKKMEYWNEVNLTCKRILIESIDLWDIWKEYINSVFEQITSKERIVKNKTKQESDDNQVSTEKSPEKNSQCEGDIVDDTPEKAHEFICRVIEDSSRNVFHLRGPYLARFELCSKLLEHNMNPEDIVGDISGLFVEYFRKFGHKQCTVSDLRGYLRLLDQDKLTDLATRLIKDVGISATSVPQSEQQMQRHICALQLSRLCSIHRRLSMDHLKALITALSLHYQHGYTAFGQNLLSTDLGPSDPYALLAVHLLYDLAQVEQRSDCIIIALMLLEKLLRYSPSNFHAKLLAVRLYHALGCGTSAHKMYVSLDVKHLQLDSLGFIHCARLPTTGLFTLCTNLYDTTLKFFASNYRDSTDYLTLSYKYGSFIKLDEFMDFRERLRNSLHYTTVVVDKIMLSLVECMSLDILYSLNVTPRETEIDWDLLRDNHDLSVYTSWDPERIYGPPEDWEETKSLFKQNVRFLELRVSALIGVSYSINVVKSTDGTREKHVDKLKDFLKNWKDLYDSVINEKFQPIQEHILVLPLPSRLHGTLETPYLPVFMSFFEFIICLCSNLDDTENISKSVTNIENQLNTLTEFLKESTMKRSNDFLDKRKTMEVVVNCVELISIAALICMLCNELVKPTQQKKGKKKATDSKAKVFVNGIGERLKKEMNNFCDILQEWVDNKIDNITDKMEILNLNSSQIVVQNILHSYNVANKEMQLILKTKVKMLSTLVVENKIG